MGLEIFQTLDIFTGTKTPERPRAKIPVTGWKKPRDFPNLSAAKIIGLDCETFDPELMQAGPGWARGKGHTVGVSIAVEGKAWYFPYAHETNKDENMDKEQVFKFLKDVLGSDVPKVGANLTYDVGWLEFEGLPVNGLLYDVQFAEALLDCNVSSVSLDALANKYLGTGKVSDVMYRWCAESFGGAADQKQRKNIYRTPPSLVGFYAEADADQPLKILNLQYKALQDAGLWDLFVMECKLIRVWLGMRNRGVTVDIEKAAKVEQNIIDITQEKQTALDDLCGFKVDVNSPGSLIRVFDKFKTPITTTAKGNPSFTADNLKFINTPFSVLINEIRKLQKTNSTFIQGAILEKHVNGKLYGNFHPLRGDDSGTVSGRLSSSKPNLQNFSSRDKVIAPMVRGLFVPESGFSGWLKLDYSQIEYRIFSHYSQDADLVKAYQDLSTDYHQIVSDMLNNILPRPLVKTLNFGSLFGMGSNALASNFKGMLSPADALAVLTTLTGGNSVPDDVYKALAVAVSTEYNNRFPAAKKTLDRLRIKAECTGEIRTLLNRKTSYNLWDSVHEFGRYPLPRSKAKKEYGSIKRANCFTALNRVTQGGSADILKKGLLDAYEDGLFNPDRLGFPHLTVHDELDFSHNVEMNPDFLRLTYFMENAIKLKVPVIFESELGSNWSNIKDYDLHTTK